MFPLCKGQGGKYKELIHTDWSVAINLLEDILGKKAEQPRNPKETFRRGMQFAWRTSTCGPLHTHIQLPWVDLPDNYLSFWVMVGGGESKRQEGERGDPGDNLLMNKHLGWVSHSPAGQEVSMFPAALHVIPGLGEHPAPFLSHCGPEYAIQNRRGNPWVFQGMCVRRSGRHTNWPWPFFSYQLSLSAGWFFPSCHNRSQSACPPPPIPVEIILFFPPSSLLLSGK